MKNICDPSEEEALTSKTKSCWLKHEISSYEIYRLIIQGNMIEVVYLHLEGIFTKILSVISDRNPGKLVFQKLKSSGVGPAGSRGQVMSSELGLSPLLDCFPLSWASFSDQVLFIEWSSAATGLCSLNSAAPVEKKNFLLRYFQQTSQDLV